MIILGSYPIRGLLGRKPRDLDLLATLQEFQDYTGERPSIIDHNHAFVKTCGAIYDCELIWPDSLSLELAELVLSDSQTLWDDTYQAHMAGPNLLYMLKMSHRYKKNSPHFLKTLNDIYKLREAGAKIKPEHESFYKRRIDETYSYGHPKLNQSKKEFFNPEDSFYVYDHDSIHEAIALGDKPAYESYKPDTNEVLTSRAMFEACPRDVQLAGVYEEACVLALERMLIPNDIWDAKYANRAFLKALEKVCTSITSGWFREFAWENYWGVVKFATKQSSYVTRFNNNQKRLRPFEGN